MLTPGLSPIGFGVSSESASIQSALIPGLSPIGAQGGSGGGAAPALAAATAVGAFHGPLGVSSGVAFAPTSAIGSIVGPLGSISATARHSPAYAPDPPPGVTYYRCRLTGAPDGRTDAILRIRSFQVRHRRDTASYYQVVIPSLEFIDAIEDRPNGQIVIWSDTDGVEEELMRGSLGDIRADRGPNNQAITISGNASRAATPLATYLIRDALYQYSTFDGEQRLRIAPRASIRPGDSIRFQGSFFIAGVVTWSVSSSNTGISAQMEVATLPDAVIPTPEPDPATSFGADGAVELEAWAQYSVLLAAGNYTVALTALTADVDLYVGSAGPVTFETAEYWSEESGTTDESVALTLAADATLYVGVYGYAAGSFTLTIGPA